MSLHPRRSSKSSPPAALTPSAAPVLVKTSMSLRKGATFHSPSSSPEPELALPYHIRTPSPPRRAQSSLDDVVDAHKRRVALTLGDIDRGLAAAESSSASSSSTTPTRTAFPDDADPVPRGVLNHTVPAAQSYGPVMDAAVKKEAAGRSGLRPRANRRPSRFTDSALGSSIDSASGKPGLRGDVTSEDRKSIVTASAITRSAAAHASTLKNLPALSPRATNRIHEHILRPLLDEASLVDFHPIVRDCPRRINEKEIVCLRDLEKTLVFMAPVSDSRDDVVSGVAHWCSRLKERAKTAALYLDFCLTSIRCIQATVEFLSDHEQTRPSDRPYTNGYFVDLVDQIKQYALQVQAAKEKEAKGEPLDDMDPKSYVPPALSRTVTHPARLHMLTSPPRTDEIKLHGGLTKNGRPAELVRVNDHGKAVSIATGMPVDIDEDSKGALQMKRSLSQEVEDDEAILRSMARRKRSASAAELAPKKCRAPGCDKEFKRPCDLTKHEKTHSRPWKCPVQSCKYHEYGWPTEKEMDRHHNDKHSAAPALYECHFKPCPYRSKRESNCKQHMEKAHGWEYVRSKNIGKSKDKTAEEMATNHGLPTPQTTNIQTPSSDGQAVNTPEEEMLDLSYERAGLYDAQNQINFPEYSSDSDMGMFAPPQLQLDYSPSSSDLNQSSSSHSPFSPFVAGTLADAFPDTFPDFGGGVDFNLYDNEDLYSARAQLPTPSHEIFQQIEASAFETSGVTFGTNPAPHISPLGHGNHMLYSPSSLDDEGFEDLIPQDAHRPGAADFQLFPSSNSGVVTNSAPTVFFGEIPKPISVYPGTTAQELLDFYAATTHAATHGQHAAALMDWSSDDQFGYGQ
jgi:uncharacterized C2H2 Zn-finger protein